MCSQEEEVFPNMHLRSFVFGNSPVKTKTPCYTERKEPPDSSPSETLCLSRTRLEHVEKSILKNSTLKYLYLEGNQICNLPESMFTSLPSLLWLDLRNNQIASLPAEIGLHRCLQTLLLEGNPISELPLELGNVISLKGLNLRNCPIIFPPREVVHQGLQFILQYLRRAMAERPVSVRKTPPELPVVEKLQLSELVRSSMEAEEESVDEEELQLFRELKDKMILLDKTELHSMAQGDGNLHLRPLPFIKRKTETITAGIIPELRLHMKTPEEKKQTVLREAKQDVLDQTRKNQVALSMWRSKATDAQEKKLSLQKKNAKIPTKRQEETQRNSRPAEDDECDHPERQPFGISIRPGEDGRSARELQQQIHAHVKKIRERCRNPRGTAIEQVAAAHEDVEEQTRKIQMRLLERKQGGHGENCFTIFTADTLPGFLDK